MERPTRRPRIGVSLALKIFLPALILSSFIIGVARAPRTRAETPPIVATQYYRTFSHAHPVLKRVRPGDTVVTKTLDSGGQDEKGVRRAEPSNPLTGPFYVEG